MRGLAELQWRLVIGAIAVASTQAMATPARSSGADGLLIVDCLLPGKVQRLGTAASYVTARRAIKTSAADCSIRGGEYTASDRATYASSMAVWLPLAKAGDVEAQTNLGEILEKGLGGAAQADLALQWYQLAAEKGHARAQVNLGSMYERGVGVPKDMAKAMEWYRRASGLDAVNVTFAPLEEVARLREERDTLSRQLEAERRERERLQIELDAVRERLGGERRSLQQKQSELDAARRELATREQALEAQRRHAETATVPASDLSRLERQLDAQRRIVAERNAELRLFRDSVAQLESRSSRLEAELSQAERRRTAEVSAARAETEVARGELARLADRLRTSDAELNSQLALVGEQRSEVQRLRQELAGQQGRTSQDHRDRVMLEAQLKQRETELIESRTRLSGLNAALARLESEAKALRNAGSGVDDQAFIPQGVNFGRYHALIVGNNDYRYMPQLQTAIHDARSVEEILRRRYGFKTTLLVNADRYQLLSALNALRERLTGEDNLLIYYAGHGELDRVNNRGYWLPIDAEANSTANWISSTQITDVLNAMAAKQILLVADSCYSGMLTRSSIARLESGMTTEERLRWLKTMASKHSRMVLTSGGVQPVLDGGGGDHSVFAAAFIAALEANAEVLEGQRLAQAVTKRVAVSVEAADIEQVPMYSPIRFAGHEAGDFFFVPAR